MNQKLIPFFVFVAVVVLIISGSAYTVKETERAVKLKFGEVVGLDLPPGLGFKIPIIHEIRTFDSRVLSTYIPQEEYITLEQKRLLVDSYIMWRIKDVKNYYTATSGNQLGAADLIIPRVKEELRNAFGKRLVVDVVSGERDQFLVEVKETVDTLVQSELGIEIIDIRVKQIELPPTVSESVYNRMRAEREREATEHRSEGREKAEIIRAEADRERRVILAEANRDSEIIRGEGDAKAAKTYAAGYNEDREFYEFYRSLIAYRSTFSSKSDIVLLKPDGEFFDYLKSSEKK